MELTEKLSGLMEMNTFNKHVGMKLIKAENGEAQIEIDLEQHHRNHMGSAHGGLTFTLADTTGGAGVRSTGVSCTTLSSNMDFLNASHTSKKLIGKARPVRIGNKIAVYDVEIWDDKDVLIARASITYYILNKKYE